MVGEVGAVVGVIEGKGAEVGYWVGKLLLCSGEVVGDGVGQSCAELMVEPVILVVPPMVTVLAVAEDDEVPKADEPQKLTLLVLATGCTLKASAAALLIQNCPLVVP